MVVIVGENYSGIFDSNILNSNHCLVYTTTCNWNDAYTDLLFITRESDCKKYLWRPRVWVFIVYWNKITFKYKYLIPKNINLLLIFNKIIPVTGLKFDVTIQLVTCILSVGMIKLMFTKRKNGNIFAILCWR